MVHLLDIHKSNQNVKSCLRRRLHEQYEGQKDMTSKMSPQVSMSNMLLGNSGELAPEGMKRLSQRRNDAQLCFCL